MLRPAMLPKAGFTGAGDPSAIADVELTLLHSIPQVVIDNPEFRHFLDDPLLFWIAT